MFWVEISVGITALIWFIILFLPFSPWSVNEQISSLAQQKTVDLADVTALIPARNEANHIAETIAALKQQGTSLNVIVIDDHSEDNTAETARLAGATVVKATELPTGWSGKLWALSQGFEQVSTKWVLQLDADITLKPGILPALLQLAQNDNRSLVSVMALLPTDTNWQKLLLPAYIWFFKMLYPFALSNSTYKQFAAAAGGCILVQRDALKQAGGYQAIRSAIIDDCTLAKLIKQHDHTIWIGLSHDVISRRASKSLADVTDLVARTAYTQLRYSLLLLLLCTLLLAQVFLVPLLALPIGIVQGNVLIMATSGVCLFIVLWVYNPLMQYYRLNAGYGLLLPFTASLYLAMTWRSAWLHWRNKGAAWKGRTYSHSP